MKKVLKYTAAGLLAIFIIIQFVPANLPENSTDLSSDIINTEIIPDDVKLILKKACYDCHSSQTVYPWYSKVAPVSWLVAKDTREGREELNLSQWSEMSKRKKIKTLSDMAEEVEKKNMPLKIYTVIHKDAILSDEEITTFTSWASQLSDKILEGE